MREALCKHVSSVLYEYTIAVTRMNVIMSVRTQEVFRGTARVSVRESTNYRGSGSGADGLWRADRQQTRDQNWLKAVKTNHICSLHCTFEYEYECESRALRSYE